MRPLPFLLLSLLAGCDRAADAVAPFFAAPTAQPLATAPGSAQASASASAAAAAARSDEACRQRIARLGGLPALPGAPGYEARRVEILGRAKGEAVAWQRAPKQAEGLSLRLELFRREMEKQSPIRGIPKVSEQLRYAPEDARKLFLPEGYVYSESPDVATVLIDVLKLGRLFRERELWMARGAEVVRVERDKSGTYRYAEGERQGDEAALLMGDRVALSRDELFPLLHRDLSAVVEAYAPDQVQLTRMTEEGAVAELRYGSVRVAAALDDDGRRYSVACAAPAAEQRAEFEAARSTNLARAGSTARVREAVRAMIDERLRFDEPLEEVGQQDGSLRPLWKWAYDHGSTGYRFNDVGYQVFDARGRPQPPQVCVDFVLDAYERASGVWFRGESEPRERTPGSIDFEATDLRNRRSAAEFVTFASAHPEMFDVWHLPDEERVPFGRRGDFFRYITEHAEKFHAGDMVVIHGMKDDGLPHYHSFLIDALDPLTGFPYRLAGNAGRPRLQSWEGVMRGAPMRSIRHVVSPQRPWLAAVLPPRAPELAHR